MTPFEFPVRVYLEDTDAGGLIYHARYLHFMERARTEMLLARGIDHAAMIRDQGLMFVVAHLEIDYQKPGKLRDDLTIVTAIAACGGASLTLKQDVRRGEETLAAATIRLVCVNREGKPCRIPDEIRAQIVPT